MSSKGNKPLRMPQLLVSLSMTFVLMFCSIIAQAETPGEWVWLGQQVHGGFGAYIALGIRIGLDAMRQLHARLYTQR